MNIKKRVALIGHGHLGKWHAQKISQNELWDFCYIVDPVANNDNDQKTELKRKYPNVDFTDDFNAIIGQVDIAIIACSTSSHFEIANNLLENDIHVFCEKPMTVNITEAKALHKTYMSKLKTNEGLKFQVGHSERYHEAWENSKLNEFFTKANSLIHLKRVAPNKGRASDVSVIEDLMIHDVDLMLYLTNCKPITVQAQAFKSLTNNFDHVRCFFTLENGSEVIIEASRCFYREYRQIEVVNNLGSAGINLMDAKIELFHAKDNSLEIVDYNKRDHLLLEQKDFSHSIDKNLPTNVTINDGLMAMTILDSINKSIVESRVITLDFKGLS